MAQASKFLMTEEVGQKIADAINNLPDAAAAESAKAAAASAAQAATSQSIASGAATTAATYAEKATENASAAKTSADSAEAIAQEVAATKTRVLEAETNAKDAAASAAASEAHAKTSEENAAESTKNYKLAESWAVGGTGERTGEDTDNSKYYATQAASSKTAAASSASAAASSKTAAATSATAAATSASNAKTSASNADGYRTQAANSATAAATSATNAKTSETNAASSATAAATSASNAKTSETNAASSKTAAASSASAAASSETAAATSATNAKTSETNAAASATAAAASAKEAASATTGVKSLNSLQGDLSVGFDESSGDVYVEGESKTILGSVLNWFKANIATIKSAIGNATTSAAGLMTTAQVTKLNGIAEGATKTNIVNNLTATTAGSALDAVQGKALSDQISSLNSSLANKVSAMPIMSSGNVDTLTSNACVWINGYNASSFSGTLPYTNCHMLFVVIDASAHGYITQFAFGPNKSTNRTYTVSTQKWSAWVGI